MIRSTYSPRGLSEAASYADAVAESTTGVERHQRFTNETVKKPQSNLGLLSFGRSMPGLAKCGYGLV